MPSAPEKSSRAQPRRGRPPGSSSDATRQRILTAACECFGARGYEATTNNDIGDRAGVTGAAIYRYFDSKQVLYVEAVAAAHREILPFFRDAVSGATTAREGLVALARAYAAAYDRFPTLSPFLAGIAEEMRRHPELASALMAEPETVLTIVVEIVERGVGRGEIEPDRSSAIVSMFLAATIGLSLHASIAGKAGLDDAVDGFIRLLEGRLFARALPRSPARRARPR
jgi:AcrR family transcriptional regulator